MRQTVRDLKTAAKTDRRRHSPGSHPTTAIIQRRHIIRTSSAGVQRWMTVVLHLGSLAQRMRSRKAIFWLSANIFFKFEENTNGLCNTQAVWTNLLYWTVLRQRSHKFWRSRPTIALKIRLHKLSTWFKATYIYNIGATAQSYYALQPQHVWQTAKDEDAARMQ
jgi:hypothetical protein